MYEYGDLFSLNCTTTTATTASDFYGYDTHRMANSYAPPLYHPPPPLALPINEFDAAFPVLKSEIGYSSSSSYGSPSSLQSCYVQQQQQPRRPNLVQRSLSSHSLQKDGFYHPIFSSLDESRPEIFDSDSGSMRKVFSTGDLQGINMVQHSSGQSESPLSQEACTIDGMNKVGRYSAEERKERIERYRSKRNQRNFNKKIKYACRKTLADSRPRIRGRFARNDEMGESSQVIQWNQMEREDHEEDDDMWLNFFDAFSVNLVP
ncbi:Cct motif family protein [Thalictrum thalictroides]|uniref:Cct motif family protein n=1 Tax=Thalictrum thalictroides TaxID=46969 RepID=A0A7J6XCW0_THATH|nr:Cct motif family protein [Thalictrum thalictroides]